MKDKSFLEKLSDPFKNLTTWYAGLGTWGRILVASLVILIMGISVIIMLPTLKPEKAEGGLPSLIDGSLIKKQTTSLRSLISGSLLRVEDKIGLSDYLCGFMFQQGLNNITVVGNLTSTNTTVYDPYGHKYSLTIPWMSLTNVNCYRIDNQCICVVPV